MRATDKMMNPPTAEQEQIGIQRRIIADLDKENKVLGTLLVVIIVVCVLWMFWSGK